MNGNKPSNIIWSTGMSYVERDVGPINTWTIPSTTTDVVSYSGTNTISLNGKGGHYEICYKAFTVNKTGSYTISYDYDLPTVNFYGTGSSHMHFGIYITTNQPPGGDMGTWSDYSTGNCNGTDICGPSSQYNSPGTGHISFNYSLTAGTTYYLWVPMMNLADGVQTYLTFTNLNVKSVNQYATTVEPELWYNGSKIWPSIPDKVMWFNDTNTYNSSAARTINFTTKPTTSDYQYFTIRFNGHPGALGVIYLRRGTSQFAYMRGHPYISYSGIVPVGNGSAYTSCTPIASMNTGSLDGWTFYQTSLWPKGTDKWVKIAFDRPNMTAHIYVESTYVCTAKMQYDPITITNLYLADDQNRNRAKVSNISIAAFGTLDDAKAYSGPF